MVYRVIMLICCLVAVWLAFRHGTGFMRSLLMVTVIAVSMTFAEMAVLADTGIALFMLIALATVLYALMAKNLDREQRIVLGVTAVLVLISHLFVWYRLPGARKLTFALTLPIGLFIFVLLAKARKYRKILPLMLVLAADAAIRLAILLRSIWGT